VKGLRKNKFTFLSVEAPVWQGAKVQAYQDMSNFRNAARRDASVLKNVKLFLREPLTLGWKLPAGTVLVSTLRSNKGNTRKEMCP
jgi:hypothetical protein